jgi:hypothetical protein
MIDFKVYERPTNLVLVGTPAELAGQKGTIDFINVRDTTKRVGVIIGREDGTSALVNCSSGVSARIRSGEFDENVVAGLNIVEGDSGIPFISQDAVTKVTYKVADLKIKKVVPVAVSLQDLIAL